MTAANPGGARSQQTILEHLGELRVRLTWIVAGLVLASIVSFTFTDRLLQFLIAPYGDQLQTLSPVEGLETYFKVALVTGAALSMPWTLVQVWLFVEPGLEKQEKRYAYIFVPGATLLFVTGVLFTWLVLLPSAIAFLANFMPEIFVAEWTGREYISFATTFLFWIGISFELPLVVYFLARFGLVSGRALRNQWRFALVGIAVAAAMITPSIDPVTMLLTMAPLLVLYLLGIGLAVVGQRQFERSMALSTPES